MGTPCAPARVVPHAFPRQCGKRYRERMNDRLDADDPCPVRDGYAMPPEWAPHERTWMCWPCRIEAWGGPEGLLRAKQAVARVARAISTFEPVTMAVRPEDAAEVKLATAG